MLVHAVHVAYPQVHDSRHRIRAQIGLLGHTQNEGIAIESIVAAIES